MTHTVLVIPRRNSIFSAFRMGPAASERGPWDFDRVFFGVGKSRVKKLEVLARRKYTNNLGFLVGIIIGTYMYIFVVLGLPIF